MRNVMQISIFSLVILSCFFSDLYSQVTIIPGNILIKQMEEDKAELNSWNFYADALGDVLFDDLYDGLHEVRTLVKDSTGLLGEDRIVFNVADEIVLSDVMNYPNPFR